MDVSTRTAQLCIAGTRSEFERRLDDARRLYQEAWDAAIDDCDAAVAAHYIAHLAENPEAALHWNLVALDRAGRDRRTAEFLPSLYVSLGASYESVGEQTEAERYYARAAEHGLIHRPE